MLAEIEVVPTGSHQQPLLVNPGGITSAVDFKLKVKQRKIEVKKFGQQ